MKNNIIILFILIVPIAVFMFLNKITNNQSVSAASFNDSVGKAKVIKFYSPMCSECKTVGKNLENAMEDYKDEVVLEEINAGDTDPKTKSFIAFHRIKVVPTLVFVNKEGKTTRKHEGMIEEREIKQCLDEIK